MSNILDLAYQTKSGLEFVSALKNGPLKESFDELKGTPIKDYPEQRYPKKEGEVEGSLAITISQELEGKQHAEYDRTGFGEVQLHGVLNGDVNTFFGLSEANFRLIQQYIYKAIKKDGAEENIDFSVSTKILQKNVDAEKLQALVILLGIHDLAKIKEFQDKIKSAAQKHGLELDLKEHDEFAWAILTSKNEALITELYPNFAKLNPKQRNLVLGGLAGAINPGRIFQLEGTPGEFAKVVRDGGIDFDPAMYAAFHLLDMGSIRGNTYVVSGEPLLNAQGKRADVFWNNFIIGFMSKILGIAGQVATGKMTPVQAYDEVVKERAQQFGLNPEEPTERAATRLCAMMTSRFPKVTADEAQAVVAFLKDNESSEKQWKKNFIQELNITGYEGTPSICIGYAPDLAAKIAAGMTKENPGVTFIEMFDVFARSFNNSFVATRAEINKDTKLKGLIGQITTELEQVIKLLADNCKAFYQGLPSLIKSGDGFVVTTLVTQPEVTVFSVQFLVESCRAFYDTLCSLISSMSTGFFAATSSTQPQVTASSNNNTFLNTLSKENAAVVREKNKEQDNTSTATVEMKV